MDIQTSHLLSKLDRLIDNQRDQGELLHQILEGPPASTKPGPDDLSGSKVTAITAPITRGAMMWILGGHPQLPGSRRRSDRPHRAVVEVLWLDGGRVFASLAIIAFMVALGWHGVGRLMGH
jgi:hypothetical protein